MVILGLGSNLGDRLGNLRRALQLLKTINHFTVKQIAPVYISDALLPENAPINWNTPYLNTALRCDTTLTPYELLEKIKEIEVAVGRTPEKNWGPRIIDIDILAWDDFIQYDEKLHIPHENLHERPFALWPLSDVAPHWIYPLNGEHHGKTAAEIVLTWGSRFSGDAPLHTKQIQHRIDTPQLVGILNLTPDSFSDGGKFIDSVAAIQHVTHLVKCGAEIIDIGAESTGPLAKPLSTNEEWQRLEPVLNLIMSEVSSLKIIPKISIDTHHEIIARKALNLNINWINDVSGLTQAAMREAVSDHTCDVVIMHHLHIPENRQVFLPRDQDVIETVYQWAEKQIAFLEKNQIARERIIFDIGIGYGKTAEQSLILLKNIAVFHSLGVRLIVGHSRKSFLQQFTTQSAVERDLETVAISLFLAKQAIDYLRVHNIDAHARAFKVAATLQE